MTKIFPILPDLTCPELDGYKLPPCSRCQEDGVEKLSISAFPFNEKTSWGRSYSYDNEQKRAGFKVGYHKARDKYEFTESDLRQAITEARKFPYIHKGCVKFDTQPDSIIQSLRTPRHPIAIEVEMEYYYMSSVKLYGKDAGWVKCDKIQFDGIKESIPTCPLKEIPATNHDGTVKGRYIYE